MDNKLVHDIKNEYKKIDNQWMHLHFQASAGLVVFAILVEIVIGMIICNSSELNTTIPRYIIKYLVIPCATNLLLVMMQVGIMKSRLSDKVKIYGVSLTFVGICFVLFTVHVIFSSLYFIFIVAIMLTSIYADYVLTVVTAIVSILCYVISDLFIVWDPDKVSVLSNALRLGEFLLAIFLTVAFTAVCLLAISYQKKKTQTTILLELDRHRLKKRLRVDELTKVSNRKALAMAIRELELDQRYKRYVIAMIDVDNFKIINDTMGHGVGDVCLEELGRVLRENAEGGTAYRYGGDEFCIIFRDYTIERALNICKNIQDEIEKLEIGKKAPFTLSMGLAEYQLEIPTATVLRRADQALYKAKEERNSICIYT